MTAMRMLTNFMFTDPHIITKTAAARLLNLNWRAPIPADLKPVSLLVMGRRKVLVFDLQQVKEYAAKNADK
jgi:hypothetical protein